MFSSSLAKLKTNANVLNAARDVSFLAVKSALLDRGFEVDRKKGRHVHFVNGDNRVTVPDHGKKDIAKGTISSIIRQVENAGFDKRQFKKEIGFGR